MKNPVSQISEDLRLLDITSTGFEHLGVIPIAFTCEGSNHNPPLQIEKIPEDTKSLVLIVEDPDAPARVFTHWVVWNIPPVKDIHENSVPGIQGMNDYTQHHYKGPCPPSGGAHHYHFKIYALKKMLDLEEGATKHELEKSMSPHIIAFGEIIGLYKRTFI